MHTLQGTYDTEVNIGLWKITASSITRSNIFCIAQLHIKQTLKSISTKTRHYCDPLTDTFSHENYTV